MTSEITDELLKMYDIISVYDTVPKPILSHLPSCFSHSFIAESGGGGREKERKKDLWISGKRKSNQLILYFTCSEKNAGFTFPPSPAPSPSLPPLLSSSSLALLLFLSLIKLKRADQQVCDLYLNGIVQRP